MKIQGYDKLSPSQKTLFDSTYKKHQECFGEESRKLWTAKKVKWCKTYLRVEFVNGEWLHYTVNGTWY